jgi:GH24 family phage-related lysozyme (muramidase)
MQSRIRNTRLVSTREAIDTPPPITFNVPPPPPAHVQHVDPSSSAAARGSFKDFYHSNISSFNADSSFIHKAASYIKKNEGVRNKIYRDSKGLLTIGIGHLVRPEEMALFKGKTLTDDQVEALFKKDVDQKMVLIQRHFGSTFNSFPEAVKIAILDGYFRGDLSSSPNTRNLLKSGNFGAAAKEYLNNKEYRHALSTGSGVAARMQRNAELFRLAKKT